MLREEEFGKAVKPNAEAGGREGVKALLKVDSETETTGHIKVGYQDLTPARLSERGGHYTCNRGDSTGRTTLQEQEQPCEI